MKICISKSTYDSFKSDFDTNCHGDEFILLDSDGEIASGDGRPDIAFISYELMFKSLRSKEFFKKYLELIDGCSFVQGCGILAFPKMAPFLPTHEHPSTPVQAAKHSPLI